MVARRGAGQGSFGLEIEGLAEFHRGLKKAIGTDFDKLIKEANYKAAEMVRVEAQSIARSQGGVAAKAAPSLRSSKTKGYASIRGGGPKYPYFWGAEFGSLRFGQFERWRGNQFTGFSSSGVGYFLHPAIRDQREKVMQVYSDFIDRATESAFPD